MKIKYTPSFIQSAKRYSKKNYPMDEVKKCVAAIVKNDKKFLVKHKDHSLSKNVRELHIDRQYDDGDVFDGWRDAIISSLVVS